MPLIRRKFVAGQRHCIYLDNNSDAAKLHITMKINKGNMYAVVWKDHQRWELGRYLLRDKLKDNDEVDHVDRNPCNNRLNNLRIVTRTENVWNRGMFKNNTSGFIGVNINKTGMKKGWKAYEARIWNKSKCIFLGSFATARGAAEKYNSECIRLRGQYAHLNKL